MPSLGYIQKGPKLIPNEGNNGGGGGAALPEVTSADAGKVLAVNNSGEWVADNIVVVIEDNEGVLSKTWKEIYDLLAAKKICMIYASDSSFALFDIIVSATENGPEDYSVRSAAGEYRADDMNGYPYFD